jgi:hypothetical protein
VTGLALNISRIITKKPLQLAFVNNEVNNIIHFIYIKGILSLRDTAFRWLPYIFNKVTIIALFLLIFFLRHTERGQEMMRLNPRKNKNKEKQQQQQQAAAAVASAVPPQQPGQSGPPQPPVQSQPSSAVAGGGSAGTIQLPVATNNNTTGMKQQQVRSKKI